jgi:hypothetical protein
MLFQLKSTKYIGESGIIFSDIQDGRFYVKINSNIREENKGKCIKVKPENLWPLPKRRSPDFEKSVRDYIFMFGHPYGHCYHCTTRANVQRGMISPKFSGNSMQEDNALVREALGTHFCEHCV